MKVTINIPDNRKDRVLEAFGEAYGYQAETTDAEGNTTPNPQPLEGFFNERLKSFIQEVVVGVEVNRAGETARDAARQKAESEVVL